MPPGCGPGKYAVAVSLEPAPSDQQSIPVELVKRLEKRGIDSPTVYSFTFDYDYSPIVRRQDANKLIRIDYSDDPGYWANVVLAKPGSPAKREEDDAAFFEKRSVERRALQDEVDREHGGSWERFLDHRWSLERRSTSHDDLHLLHKKWFSANLADWIYEQRHVDVSYDLVRHHVQVSHYRYKEQVAHGSAGLFHARGCCLDIYP
jgi:chitinase